MILDNLHLDRVPENPKDIQIATIPNLVAPNRYEDLLEIEVAEDLRSAEPPSSPNFRANLKRWYLRLN